MTPDLKILIWVVALTVIQVIVAALAATGQVGLPALASNRDGMRPLEGFAGRAQRAHRNTLESLPVFVALVLVAHVAGRADATTLLGAQLFLWGPGCPLADLPRRPPVAAHARLGRLGRRDGDDLHSAGVAAGRAVAAGGFGRPTLGRNTVSSPISGRNAQTW